MKAICTKRLVEYVGHQIFFVDEGNIIDYTVKDSTFIVNDVAIKSAAFFNHFKVIEGGDKIKYSDFEYILCNYVFRNAVLFPEEYNGVRHLIIQDWTQKTIMITINKFENSIRVSFPTNQETYSTYEDALDGIRNYK